MPKDLSFDFIGIDMCRGSLKVMKMQDSKFGKIPMLFKEYTLKEECGLMLADPEYKNCDETIDTLKKVKKDFNVDYVNVSIPEVKTYIYKIKLPSNVGDKIHEALLFSVTENVPVQPDNILLDYFVVGETEDEIEVIVTVVPQNVIDLYTKLFENAGLKPISFEPETHAITRAIINKGDKSQYLLLNLRSCVSSVAVIDNEVVQHAQTISITSKDFKEGFNKESAKMLKEDINKIIIYWETSVFNAKNKTIQTLYLAGDLPIESDLIHYLEKNLPVNVKVANVWVNSFSLDEYIPKINAKDSVKYATAVGLSLKRIK